MINDPLEMTRVKCLCMVHSTYSYVEKTSAAPRQFDRAAALLALAFFRSGHKIFQRLHFRRHAIDWTRRSRLCFNTPTMYRERRRTHWRLLWEGLWVTLYHFRGKGGFTAATARICELWWWYCFNGLFVIWFFTWRWQTGLLCRCISLGCMGEATDSSRGGQQALL